MFTKEKTEWKIPPKKIPADDCIIQVDGVDYKIHENEWIEAVPVGSMREYIHLMSLSNINEQTGNSLDELCDALSHRILDWNWTGMDNKSLPKPYKNKNAIINLSANEILWLINAIQSETQVERKND